MRYLMLGVLWLVPLTAWAQTPVLCTLTGTTITCPPITVPLRVPGYTFEVPPSTTTTIVQPPSTMTTTPGSGTASDLDTALTFTGSGLQVTTFSFTDGLNKGLALWPHTLPRPLPPTGGDYALNVYGDAVLGDVVCLDDPLSNSGCGFGGAFRTPRGARLYQSNRFVNTNDGQGGPALVLWPDVAGIDGSGNRGYMDIWGWGQPDTPFSGSLNFGVRGNDGTGHRLFRLTNNLELIFPELGGSGIARLCIGPTGIVQRGGC